MSGFEIGLSALRASRIGLDVVANNIANANTNGYHRQRLHNEALSPDEFRGFRIGRGVAVTEISHVRNLTTEASLTSAISDGSHIEQLIITERQIQEIFVGGGTSITEGLDSFFAEITELSSSAGDVSLQTSVTQTANRLSETLRQATTQLTELRGSVRSFMTQEVTKVNSELKQLATSNVAIRDLRARGVSPATEIDNRDALINSMAESVGISRNESATGQLNLTVGNAAIQETSFSQQLSVELNGTGDVEFYFDDSPAATELKSGRLTALQELHNTTIPKYMEKLNQFASELIRSFDAVHATGVGTEGSFEGLTASRAVGDVFTPLSEANAPFPVRAGDLTITITDPSGEKRNEVVSIDPSTDSLDDVRSRINSISGLSAVVGTVDNLLRIAASPGVKFDFTGTVATNPDTSGLTGTSVPTAAGVFTGDTNQDLTFTFAGSGDVGQTDNLSISVTDRHGTVVNTVDIGVGYEVGTPIDLGNGVKITLGAGSIVDGESFAVPAIAAPDETGLLASIGLNSFFSGSSAGDIRVSKEVLENPYRFAAGKTPDVGDTRNLFKFSEIESARTLPGDVTLTQFINDTNTAIGFELRADEALSTSLTSMQERLIADRDSVSGVDLNEEIVQLQKFQRSYEAAARVIQAADDMLSTLLGIVG